MVPNRATHHISPSKLAMILALPVACLSSWLAPKYVGTLVLKYEIKCDYV